MAVSGRAYIQSMGSLGMRDILLTACWGLASGLVFLFIFPGRAISTLMHHTLHLPGPGAGIGFIAGPYIILWALIAWTHTRKAGVALCVCILSGAIQALGGSLGGPSAVLGWSVVPQMILAALLLGLVLDISIFAMRRLQPWIAYPCGAVVANTIFLITYWVAVFPSVKGWIAPLPALVLALLGVTGALLFGTFAPVLYVQIKFKRKKSDDQQR
ncbi:MAG: hypothetical protein AB1665_07250 [Candidatus Thermoplasmatota archaeon]